MKKIIIRGPVLSQSGYGEQARFALRALKSRPDLFEIYIIPTGWGQTGWIAQDNEERQWIDERCKETAHLMQSAHTQKIPITNLFHISLQVTIPNEWKSLAQVNIGYTAGIETTKVSPVWIQKANMMDRIIVTSNHSKEIFNNTEYPEFEGPHQYPKNKTETPIDVVNYPVRHFNAQKINLELDFDFNYLAISQWGPRKNFENLIKWFLEENFDQEVGLVVKTSIKNNSIIDRTYVANRLKHLLKQHGKSKCKVYLLHGDLSNEELTSVYQHPKIKAYVSTTHGEGFGLPLFEAAYNGLPVIAPGWSGQRDFLYMPDTRSKSKNKNKMRPMFASVEYDLQPIQAEACWEDVLCGTSQWAFPREASFKRRLREVRNEYSRFKKNSKKLQKYLINNFTEENQYNSFCETFSFFITPPLDDETQLQNTNIINF